MRTKPVLITLILIFLLSTPPVIAEFSMPEPNWDRGMAMQAVEATDTRALLAPLFDLARNGDNASLLKSIDALQHDDNLSAPAIDYLVFTFTVGLSDLEANSVSTLVMNALLEYEPRTRVAHDDNNRVGVPLFNVRAAATGVQHSWERQNGDQLAQQLEREMPSIWIEHYLAASPAEKRGFVDSLAIAREDQLVSLGWAAISEVEKQPDLARVAARAGLYSGDQELVWHAIMLGNVSELPLILRMIPEHYDSTECAELLARSLTLESNTKKSLAIAQLGPVSLNEQKSQDVLFSVLDNRELGAGAALVLSGSSNPSIAERLNHIAGKQDGLAGQRASLAIHLRQAEARSEQ